MKNESIEPDNAHYGQTLLCCVCVSEEELTWSKEINDRLVKNNLCFSCNFWYEHYQNDQRPEMYHISFVAKNVHYLICSEDSKFPFKGFGGARFRIRFFDDNSIVESRNVWTQGHITDFWLEKFPDTAEILNEGC